MRGDREGPLTSAEDDTHRGWEWLGDGCVETRVTVIRGAVGSTKAVAAAAALVRSSDILAGRSSLATWSLGSWNGGSFCHRGHVQKRRRMCYMIT